MKKICILSAVNIRHMSLISLYTEKLDRDNIDYDIIYMDKYGEEEEFSAKNKYVFKNIINKSDNRYKKIIQYFKFRKFAIPILEENKYDFIIVWNDVAIFMFADYLARKWKQKYCLNIRDYSGQKNPLIYLRFKHVIDNSAFTTISSNGFKDFLPQYDYLHVHSLNMEVLSKISPRTQFQTINEPIRITFIGNVRFFDMNTKLLDVFKNDMRFQLQFYGTNANKLKIYASNNGISNTCFHDAFPVKDTNKFIEKTDIVNNLYGKGQMSLDYALSIKLYHGIYNNTPILVFSGTEMANIINENKIGYVIDSIDKNLPDDIFNWYRKLDFDEFKYNCLKLLDEIKKSNFEFEIYYKKHLL